MTDEDRKRYIEGVFTKVAKMAEEDPIGAAIEFMTWLRSPEGALAWGYLWKPEYIALVRDITFYAMGFVNKILIREAIRKGLR